MRKLLLLCLLYIGLGASAQTVGYTYRPLAAEGCNMKYSVTKQDSAYYIIVTVRSDRLKFLKESTFLIKNFDGEVIRLQGDLLCRHGNIVTIPFSTYFAFAVDFVPLHPQNTSSYV